MATNNNRHFLPQEWLVRAFLKKGIVFDLG
jgi:hypothetical protein